MVESTFNYECLGRMADIAIEVRFDVRRRAIDFTRGASTVMTGLTRYLYRIQYIMIECIANYKACNVMAGIAVMNLCIDNWMVWRCIHSYGDAVIVTVTTGLRNVVVVDVSRCETICRVTSITNITGIWMGIIFTCG